MEEKKYSGFKDGKVIGKSKFGQHDLIYKVPEGLMYPIVSAFRSLIELDEDNKIYKWKKDPFGVWKKYKKDIVKKIMNFALSIGDNPNAVGKDSNIWDLAYMTVRLSK
ncbi:hypothetical protein [Listeria cornellensis]|uniref:hypothetical protein n=1 Tax=Listeria cornellensis TaxID=1494961 RepID=UPI0004AFDE1A|nr:hypothetical protein [Listeria cornellensis]